MSIHRWTRKSKPHVQRRDRRRPVHHAEIAAALYITPGTAKTHVARLLATLGARDRIQLVITAYQAGLFDT